MDFDLNDDQRLLQESVSRLVSDHYDFAARRRYLKEPEGWSRQLWSQYAELGLLGLPFAEADGGFGGGPLEIMIVMKALGRAAILEPYLPTVLLCGSAIARTGDEWQRETLLPRIIAGDLKLAFAHQESQARYDSSHVTATARRESSGWILDGTKSTVLHGDSADQFLVSARTSGNATDRSGITLFLVNASALGVSRIGYALRDGSRAADITFESVALPSEAMIGKSDFGFSIIQRITEDGIMATVAEAIGAMEVIHEMTLEYVKTRAQFGRTIGSFQVLQHRLADMYVCLEQARSMAMFAAMAMDEPDLVVRAHNLSMAKAAVGQWGKFVSQQGIQLHGGIGMTDEHAIGHYFRRIMVIEHMFGDTAFHLARVAERLA